MKKLTMLLLACALMALTTAAAVPEGKPEAVKEEASVQEAAPEAEPVLEEPPAEEVIIEEVLETLAEESFLPKDLPERPEEMESIRAMIKDLPEEVQKELAEGGFRPRDLPEESEDMEMVQTMEEDDSLSQRSLCRRGWRNFGKRCFIYFPTEITWAQAERNCRVLGGHLASIHTHEEYRFIQQMIFRVTNGYPATWIGASDAQEEGVWLWSDGSRFSSTFWCHGEPNNLFFLQDCAQMNHGAIRCWADVHCSRNRPYVCASNL